MKILIFMTHFEEVGGAERLAVELAEDLNKRGIHTDILSMYTEDLPGVREATAALLKKGIPAVHFLGMKIHPSPASMIPAIMKLRRLIQEGGYDIVETSILSPTVLAAWATHGMRVRHVVGLHQAFRKDRENTKQHGAWRFSVRCNRRIRYYAVSDYAANAWAAYSGTSARHIRRIYNAIPDDCFNAAPDRHGVRDEFGIPEDARILVYVGRLAEYKGIGTLLNAVGPILEENGLFLLYVGFSDPDIAGTKEMLEDMDRRIVREGWTDRVRFIGVREDVPRLMASSDLLVHPARVEGFGLVLAEALAAGLPVVASNAEGIPEVLSGTDSIMVSPDDPDALREAVLTALDRTPEGNALAIAKGRARAEAFRLSTRVDAMIGFFEDVLHERF